MAGRLESLLEADMAKRDQKKPPKSGAGKPVGAAAKAKVSATKAGAAKVKTGPVKTVPAKAKPTEKKSRKVIPATGKKVTARAKESSIVLSPNYRPSEDEPFMNPRQRTYFRLKLTAWKEEIIHQTKETLAGLHEDSTQHADIADRATSETDRALELRARDRQRKLISKIDAALSRIEDGTYGYCDETGEPIGLKRLDARPIATLSLEAQERHERRERVYRED